VELVDLEVQMFNLQYCVFCNLDLLTVKRHNSVACLNKLVQEELERFKKEYGKTKALKARRVSSRNNQKSEKRNQPTKSKNKTVTKRVGLQSK
jgi:hypothetical protein